MKIWDGACPKCGEFDMYTTDTEILESGNFMIGNCCDNCGYEFSVVAKDLFI